MKKVFLIVCIISISSNFAQEHFGGISTSSRVGILNTLNNPAEFANLSKKIEVNVFGLSLNVANNKIGFSDLTSDTNLEDLIFKGTEPVNMSVNAELIGPSVAFHWQKWGFGVTTKAMAKFDLVDIDSQLGNAIKNNSVSFINSPLISNNYNQRMFGTSWGEVGLSAARTLFENDKNRINVGLTLKFLFPGSYSNFGVDKFQGSIIYVGQQAYLTNTHAALNFSYSGSLADSFTNFDDYSKSVFGNLDGVATDFGINYQRKDGNKKYKLNAGFAVRNIGSMTFKDNNNYATNYELNIQPTVANPNGLNLSVFNGTNSDNLNQIEKVLLQSGYLNKTVANKTEFKVKLPTVFSAYLDLKLVPKLYVSLYTQQKLNSNNNNDQITAQNIVSITPRLNLGFFETYTSWSKNEISGVNGGLGFRLGGFYIGSNSIITALINDSKQADFYTGFRFAML